jgi:hypothetical protein
MANTPIVAADSQANWRNLRHGGSGTSLPVTLVYQSLELLDYRARGVHGALCFRQCLGDNGSVHGRGGNWGRNAV